MGDSGRMKSPYVTWSTPTRFDAERLFPYRESQFHHRVEFTLTLPENSRKTSDTEKKDLSLSELRAV